MKVKIKQVDNEETVLIWLTKADSENKEALDVVDAYNQKYKNVVVYRSGSKPLEDNIKMMVRYQKSKGI